MLKREKAEGGLTADLYDALRANPALAHRIAAELLEAHFEPSLHEDILSAIGFPWTADADARPPRDPAFRREILRVYEHRCAICGYDGRLGDSDLGLEAAHVKWHAAGGPDTVENGLSLCVFHHRAFDRGALGLDEARHVLVSQEIHGSAGVDDLLLRFAGTPLRGPMEGVPSVLPEYSAWHRREVFRPPPRVA